MQTTRRFSRNSFWNSAQKVLQKIRPRNALVVSRISMETFWQSYEWKIEEICLDLNENNRILLRFFSIYWNILKNSMRCVIFENFGKILVIVHHSESRAERKGMKKKSFIQKNDDKFEAKEEKRVHSKLKIAEDVEHKALTSGHGAMKCLHRRQHHCTFGCTFTDRNSGASQCWHL